MLKVEPTGQRVRNGRGTGHIITHFRRHRGNTLFGQLQTAVVTSWGRRCLIRAPAERPPYPQQ